MSKAGELIQSIGSSAMCPTSAILFGHAVSIENVSSDLVELPLPSTTRVWPLCHIGYDFSGRVCGVRATIKET